MSWSVTATGILGVGLAGGYSVEFSAPLVPTASVDSSISPLAFSRLICTYGKESQMVRSSNVFNSLISVLSPALGLWRMLEIPYMGLAS